MESKEIKFIKEGIGFLKIYGNKGSWIRIPYLTKINYYNDGARWVSPCNPRVTWSSVFPYEDWMEEYLGTDKDLRKDERFKSE